MSARDRSFQAILVAIDKTRLPDSHTAPLVQALKQLFDERPNAVDKVQAPLGRALRNPTFPGLWDQCVGDIPKSDAYSDLRSAALAIAALVASPAAD